MALTPGRWTACAIVGCAAIAAAMIASVPDYAAYDTPMVTGGERGRAARLGRRVSQTYSRWITAATRDSIFLTLRTRTPPSHAGPTIAIDPSLGRIASLVERTVTRQWRILGIDTARVPVTVAVAVDTVAREDFRARGTLSHSYILPNQTPDGRCVSIMVIGEAPLARAEGTARLATLLGSEVTKAAVLGPCAFFARFGRPGREIERWLESRSYDLAVSPRWGASTPFAPAAQFGGEAAPSVFAWPRDILNARVSSLNALSCVEGDPAECESIVLAPAARPPLVSGVVTWRPRLDPNIGHTAWTYLSDAVVALGPERFKRFWTSNLPAERAFGQATGTSLGRWTQRWSMAGFGGNAGGPFAHGPRIVPIETLLSLTVIALCLAFSVRVAGRRELR